MNVHIVDLAGLYASEQGRLKQLVRRLTGNRVTAEDLVQQTFLKLAALGPDGDGIDNCPAYLTRMARNLALNHLRDTARK